MSSTLFDNVYIEHFALTDLRFWKYRYECWFLGKKLSFPLMINAMTGGTDTQAWYKRGFSFTCKTFGIALEVGNKKLP